MKLPRHIFIAVPLTFAMFFLVMLFVPSSLPLPETIMLGRSANIEITARGPSERFFVAKFETIGTEYDDLVARLRYRITDREGRSIEVRNERRFFYSAPMDDRTVHGGSVFRLPETVEYPFVGRLDSNISELDDAFWLQTRGSLTPVVTIFCALLTICIILVRIIGRRVSRRI